MIGIRDVLLHWFQDEEQTDDSQKLNIHSLMIISFVDADKINKSDLEKIIDSRYQMELLKLKNLNRLVKQALKNVLLMRHMIFIKEKKRCLAQS